MTLQETERQEKGTWRLEARTALLPACAVGLFFVWFEMAFRAATPLVSGTSGWLLLTRADVGWLTALAAASAVGLVGAACLTVMTKRGVIAGMRFRCGAAATSSRAMSGSAGLVARLCRWACLLGSAFMAVGTTLLIAAGGRAVFSVAGGIFSGIGMALLVISWLPATVRVDAVGALLIVIASALVSAGLTSLVMFLQPPVTVVFLVVCPLLCGACSLGAMWSALRRDVGTDSETRPDKETMSLEEDVRSPLFDAEGIVILLTIAAASIVGGIACVHMDMTLASRTYWYVSLSGVINAGLLAVALGLSDHGRLQPVLMILVSTSVAVMPLSLAFLGEVPCFVLTKVASLCAYCLAMVRFSETGSRLRSAGVADSLLRHCTRCMVMLVLMALAAAVGVASGDALRRAVGDDQLARVLPLVAVGLLYVVFLFYVLCVADGRRTILHVITGSFDDEAELARVRRDVMLERHPDVSARESDVLLLLLQGYSTPRIAESLCISENTTKTHLRHIYAKMGVNSRQQLMALAEAIRFKR